MQSTLSRNPNITRLSSIATRYPVIFKVAFSSFQFKFGATLRRQAERSDSEARHIT